MPDEDFSYLDKDNMEECYTGNQHEVEDIYIDDNGTWYYMKYGENDKNATKLIKYEGT